MSNKIVANSAFLLQSPFARSILKYNAACVVRGAAQKNQRNALLHGRAFLYLGGIKNVSLLQATLETAD